MTKEIGQELTNIILTVEFTILIVAFCQQKS